MKYTKKLIRTAGGLMVRVPSDIVKVLSLTERDFVEIDLNKLEIKKKSEMMKKRAQAMIFVILAVLIIVLGIMFFIYQKQILEPVENIDPKAQPVKLYVDNCLMQTALDALNQIGLSGGYIELPGIINDDPRTHLTTYPGKGFKMPYWWHDGIQNVPTEEFVKDEMNKYIQREIKTCLGDFASLEGYEINELKEPKVEVSFNEKDVSIKLDYEIELILRNGEFKTLMKSFEYTLPIRFKKVLELATNIMERENNDLFVEKSTIDLISMKKEIPLTDFEVSCGTKTWQLPQIKSNLQELLRVNLPYIKIKDTSYNPNVFVPNPDGKSTFAGSYYGNHYVWDLYQLGKEFKNMKVSFGYENWPMDIYARPSQNGILSSNAQKGTAALSFFCLQIWHFTYDIKYPVMVTVTDPETDENMPYTFRFAFKADIDHNQPNRFTTGITSFESDEEIPNDEFCSETKNSVTIFTIDNSTADDINDVNLTFVCGRYYCDLGKSEWMSLGAAAGVTTRVPYCVNAVIKGKKEGYAEAKTFMQSDLEGKSQILMLNPVKEFKSISIIKHQLGNPITNLEFKENERATIMFKGKNIGWQSFSVYPQENSFPLQVLLKDATYSVEVYVTNGNEITAGYSGEVSLSKNDLENSKGIIFHVIESETTSDDDRALFITSLASNSNSIPKPELN